MLTRTTIATLEATLKENGIQIVSKQFEVIANGMECNAVLKAPNGDTFKAKYSELIAHYSNEQQKDIWSAFGDA